MRHNATRLLLLTLLAILTVGGRAYAAETYTVPKNSGAKTYMSYKAITAKNSAQYILQQDCVTDELGFRTLNGFYTVAVGTGFHAKVGTYIDAVLDSGEVIHCVVGDIKADSDTDQETHMMAPCNTNVLEFIVDSNTLKTETKTRGDVSHVRNLKGKVETITVFDSSDVYEHVISVLAENDQFLVVDKEVIKMPNDYNLYLVKYDRGGEIKTVTVSQIVYDELTVGVSTWVEE